MGLLQQWRDTAYSQQTDKKVLQKFWTDYFMIEKGIYEKLYPLKAQSKSWQQNMRSRL